MPPAVLDKGVVSFTSQGRLLQELGLRLVASPEVALVELIKNAYDADSPDCTVELASSRDALIVSDHGHGMTIQDFKSKWMQIATGRKGAAQRSPQFKRLLTGAKGIGRFAVRYLGDYLSLETTAMDAERRRLTTLTATFDWPNLDKTEDLSEAEIPYELTAAAEGVRTGTKLVIRKLRSEADFVESRDLRTSVLRIISPLSGLEKGRFTGRDTNAATDPGFNVVLPGHEAYGDSNLADAVLSHFWARLTVSLKGTELTFTVSSPPHDIRNGSGVTRRGRVRTRTISVETSIKKGFFADIRFFPRRKGIFQGTSVDGRVAWQWVRETAGVAVIDHGFRMKPYGFTDDDWLSLDLDGAHNERDWRTKIAKSHFPIPPDLRQKPGDNPALNLPHNAQLVGGVFIESNREQKAAEANDLIPAMDREGLLGNVGFVQLKEYVRAGIEFLAHCDKQELTRIEELDAQVAAETARADIRRAIEDIQRSKTLTTGDKSRIVKQYRMLADRLEEQEEYAARSRESLITMSLLGVVAGFMTHESGMILSDLEEAVQKIKEVRRSNIVPKAVVADLEERLTRLRGFISYSKLFIRKAGSKDGQPFSAAGQVRYVIGRFKTFANDRTIDVHNEIANDVMAPGISVAAYSGIVLNLYTNALKAILSARESIAHPKIVFRAWNEDQTHVLEVLDNGPGVPPELRKRIWDPLYTTTADPDNPLGPGMGLGLTLVRQVTKELGGRVALLPKAPAGFSTCFRVALPLSGTLK